MWCCGAAATSTTSRLEQHIVAYQRRHVSVSRFDQEAELKAIRSEFPEYAAVHSHVLQDVLARLDKTYQAFFRRVQHGEKAGFPRFKGRNRYRSFTFKEYSNGATLDNGYLVVYEQKTGHEMFAMHRTMPELMGEDWEDDDLPAMYPRLCAVCE